MLEHGRKTYLQSSHMHNSMHDANNLQNPIVELNVEEPINFSSGGIRRKQVLFGYDSVAKTKDSWAFMNFF
jgi:hypothetical protein